jgi:hypothetical protein
VPLIEPVRIEGLADLNRSLRRVSSDAPKALRLAANKAADIVVTEARSRVPRRSGKAKASIKAKSTRTAARVSSGGRRAPYMPWLDYGGSVGPNKSVKRPFIADGRYVYPAFRSKRQQFERVLREALAEVARDAGLETG